MPDKLEPTESLLGQNLLELEADCANCFGLCCVALAFTASADFAVDKKIGDPCQNLQSDFRCGIHQDLKPQGYAGCITYDCFGAGQKVSQVTFGGVNWREAPDTAKPMFAALPIMRQLHELLWYLAEALTLHPAASLHDEIRAAMDETEHLTRSEPDALLALDVAAHRQNINALLLRTSEFVRAQVKGRAKDHRGADLIGAKLKGADLRGANLRGAYLIGADLRSADLRMADLIGADFRDTDLSGADLTQSIFLTQAQLNAAKGDSKTRLSRSLIRPNHWRHVSP